MPDNNGNLTDKLSVEISASVNPAIKAIDSLQTKLNLLSGSLQHFTDAGKYKSALDNMASGFERLSAVVGSIDTGSIASTAKAIGAMGGSFERVAKSALTFQQALVVLKRHQRQWRMLSVSRWFLSLTSLVLQQRKTLI